MGRGCVIVDCNMGYGNKALPEGVSVHAFPSEKDFPERRKEWIKRVGRQDWQPTKNSGVCSLHFTPDSYKTESADKNEWRRKQRAEEATAAGGDGSNPFKNRWLKDNALPSLFPPIYAEKGMQPAPTHQRTDATHAEERFNVQQREHEEQIEHFLAEDQVSSLADIALKFITDSETVPGGFIHCSHKEKMLLLLIDLPDSFAPILRASITIDSELTYSVAVDGQTVAPSKLGKERTAVIRHFTKLTNVMSQVKQWVEEENAPKPPPLKIAADALEEYLEDREEKPVLARKVAFLLEQLQLLGQDKFSRRYSPHLLVLAETIRVRSTQAYRVLRGMEIVTLPSIRTLDRIVRNLTVETGASDRDYLRMRLTNLKPEEKYCNIVIDEIHCASKIALSGGEGTIVGQTKKGKLAKTMLVFMVCSVRGKYRDVVGMYPMCGLTAEEQYTAFREVLKLICEVGLKPIAVITDNLRTNFSFMKKLSDDNQLHSWVPNPESKDQKLFLLFDYVHNIKNIYNNWTKPKLRYFDMPPMPDSGLKIAKFSDIRDLYDHESGKPLKMAHKLLKRALAPNNLERTNVSLALSVFHESTRDALEWYIKHEGKDWQGTRDFVAMIGRLWDIQNVRSLKKGKHKRNIYQDPLSDPNGRQIQFLTEFCNFLQAWKDSEKVGLDGGLTLDTFRAVQHTCKTMIELARYCIDVLGWDFVILGKFSSDWLEGHFSAYRQTHGGNFLVGIQQILQSEKKLRAVALLNYSGCSLTDLKDLRDVDTIRNATAVTIAQELTPRIEALLSTAPRKPNNTDKNIIFYVCGALVRSHMNCTNGCEACQRLLLNTGTNETMPNLSIEDNSPPVVAEFVEQVNRGGLLVPSSLVFGLGLKCWKVFETIRLDEDMKADFLTATNHRGVFVETVLNLLDEESEIEDVLVNDLTCAEGHKFGRTLITKYFHTMCKNWIKEMSTAVPGGTERKKAKLQSKTAK